MYFTLCYSYLCAFIILPGRQLTFFENCLFQILVTLDVPTVYLPKKLCRLTFFLTVFLGTFQINELDQFEHSMLYI